MTDPFTTAARAEAEKRFVITPGYWGHTASERVRIFREAAEWARDHLAAQEPTDAEVEAAHAAYWPAYSEAVRNASSNRPGQGISAEDARKAGLAGHRAALTAARAVGRDAR